MNNLFLNSSLSLLQQNLSEPVTLQSLLLNLRPLNSPTDQHFLSHHLLELSAHCSFQLNQKPIKKGELKTTVEICMSKHLMDKFELKFRPGGEDDMVPAIGTQYDERLLEQFYKKDENVVLFQVYEIICRHGHGKEMLYTEICSRYNEKYASTKKRCAQQSVKLNTLDIAHYCKKLEKIGFVDTTTNATTSEKKISLSKREALKHSQSLMTPDWDLIFPKTQTLLFKEDESMIVEQNPKRSKQKQEISQLKLKTEEIVSPQHTNNGQNLMDVVEACQQRQKIINETFHVPHHLTMRESFIRVLEGKIDPQLLMKHAIYDTGNISSDEEAQSKQDVYGGGALEPSEDGKYTLSEISAAIGMHKEEKTTGRIMNELKKSNPLIQSSAVRNGRVFQYKYFLKETVTKKNLMIKAESLRKRESKEEEKKGPAGAFGIKPFEQPQLIKSLSSNILIDLNENSFRLVQKLCSKQPEKAQLSRTELLQEYFTDLITQGKGTSAKRTLTIQTINRYIYCLNQVISHRHISLVDIRNGIKSELEKGKGYEIDKKTLKRIIEKLAQEKLVKTVDFLVTLEQSEGQGSQTLVKTLVLDPQLDESQVDLMKNPTIANPTNRQSSAVKGEFPERLSRQPSASASANVYSLRSKRRRVNYRERSVSIDKSASEASMHILKEESKSHEDEEMINTDSIRQPRLKQQESIQVPESLILLEKNMSKFSYVDESVVKYQMFARQMEKILSSSLRNNLHSAFTDIFEKAVIKTEDRDLSSFLVCQPLPQEKSKQTLSMCLLSLISRLDKPPKKLESPGITIPEYINFSSLLNAKHTEDELDSIALSTLSNVTADSEAPLQFNRGDLSSQMELIDETIKEIVEQRGSKHIHTYINGLGSIARQSFGQPQLSVFENKQSLQLTITKVCKHLSRNGSVVAQTLSKIMTTPYALKVILQQMLEQGHISLEREIERDSASQVVVYPKPSINQIYQQLKI